MFFDKIYGSWEDLQKNKYEKIMQILPDLAGKKILDIGIGSGYFEAFLRTKSIDADIVGIDVAKDLPEDSIQADGNELPFADNSFDIVICLDTMHFISKDDFKRVLSSGGYVLLSIFFNKQDLDEKRGMLKGKLNGFEILKELIIEAKESEYVVLARQR